MYWQPSIGLPSFESMIALCNCVMTKKYETTLTTHLCKHFTQDIPVFQNDNFPLNVTRQIRVFMRQVCLPCLPKKTGFTVHRTLMGCSLAQSVHLVPKSPSSVKELEIFLLEE